jgi:hypothetical protein
MAGTGFNPNIAQGLLNRVRTHIVVPGNTSLNATASYMGKSQAVLTFEGPFVSQIETATGIVNSPMPFVMAQLVISLLRTQALAALWVAQAQTASVLGNVVAYPDSANFPAVTLTNCSITEIEPGAFDGVDPVTKITVKGVFNTNSIMWASST